MAIPLRLACAVSASLLAGGAAVDRAAAQSSSAPARVELRAGDRIAFVGDSLFERDLHRGLIETALTVAHAGKGLTFRNLGWSGDTVRGESRAYFGTPADGYKELLKGIDLVSPTVIFLSYGANESFDGAAGLDAFLAGYRTLLDDLASRTPRLVLLTPLPVDSATSPLPAAAIEARRRALFEYAAAIRSLAASRQLAYIDLHAEMLAATTRPAPEPLFEHGMHLTDAGYGVASSHIVAQTGSAAVDARDARFAPLRSLVVKKNESFFHRWRPANVTYLYLFRQREQGNNAVEIPRFDPVVTAQDAEIAAMLRTLP